MLTQGTRKYTDETNRMLFSLGLHERADQDYYIQDAIESHDALVANREYKEEIIGENDLLQIFGGDVVDEKIAEYEEDLENLNVEYQKLLVRLVKKVTNKEAKEFWADAFWIVYFEDRNDWLNEQLKRLYRLQRIRDHKAKPGEITGDDIALAKQTPIENYITFNRSGFAVCIFHNDRSPSMHIYRKTNRVHCFSCGADKDVIDVVMELNQVEFIQAIKFILGK